MLNVTNGDTYNFMYDDALHDFFIEEVETGEIQKIVLKPRDLDALYELIQPFCEHPCDTEEDSLEL